VHYKQLVISGGSSEKIFTYTCEQRPEKGEEVISTSNILEQAFLAGRTGVQALREK
jgi:hypothetical protein